MRMRVTKALGALRVAGVCSFPCLSLLAIEPSHLESTRIRICLIDRLWSSYRYIYGTATAYITCLPLLKEVSLRPYVVLGPFYTVPDRCFFGSSLQP